MFAAPSTAGAMTRTLSTPSTTSSTRSTADRGVRRTAKRTLEKLKASEGAPQEAKDDQDDEPGPVDHAGLREHPADRASIGSVVWMRKRQLVRQRVDPGHEHPPEDQAHSAMSRNWTK